MYGIVKRLFDIVAAIILFLVLSPLMTCVALTSMLMIGRPVLFRQQRPGLNCRAFYLYKFRTMIDGRRDDGQQLPDSERLTGYGAFLRRFSIDELPQLINVLKGELSLVGPRPLLMEYLPLYNPEQMRRHDVKPGITGWAQVNGRNAITWDEKFRLDVWYVDHRSLALDMKILCMTVIKVFRREGISQQGQATAEKFRGNS